MLIEPELKDEAIVQCLRDEYGLNEAQVTFLPLGADFNSAVYRITTNDRSDYFLKLRSGDFCEASVRVPHYLSQIGLKNVLPPLETKSKTLWACLNPFKVILYPYIDGHNAVEAPLSAQQWLQFGATIKMLHATDIPKHIKRYVPEETFSSNGCDTVASFLKRIKNEAFDDSIAAQTALFLKSKSSLIFSLIKRVKELRFTLQNQSFDYVLCHADSHGWNLITENNDLYLIDWDTLIFAPKERDLMFIGAGIWNSGCSPQVEKSLFYNGYGETEINKDAICYYRMERILEDIGAYCERIFLSNKSNEDRMQSFEYIQANFLPNGTLDLAEPR